MNQLIAECEQELHTDNNINFEKKKRNSLMKLICKQKCNFYVTNQFCYWIMCCLKNKLF